MRIRSMLGIRGDLFASSPIVRQRNTRPSVSDYPIVPENVMNLMDKSSNHHFVEHVKDALVTLYELGILKEPTETQPTN
jgi:hypothetical protein